MAGKLTALKVKALVQPGRYGDGKGLWLQVRGPEQRSWLFRYAYKGKQRQMGLGPVDLVCLAEARDKALEARKLLFAGTDPLQDRQATKAAEALRQSALTFEAVAALYLAAHEPTWRNPKHRYQWRATLATYVYPVIGKTLVASVDTGAVMRIIEPIWRTKPETAVRIRGRIETVLDYATARSWRTGDNPARWRGHIASLLPPRDKVKAVEHHAALPWAEIGAFMTTLGAQRGVAAKALQFTIYTAARTTEALEARWTEFDLNSGLWTIPGDRMKAGREHRVPLSEPALDILRGQKGDTSEGVRDGFVFPGGKPNTSLSNMAMTAVLRRMGMGNLTVHGFRSTFRDWAGETTSYARETAEAALAHTINNKTEAAYSRGDLLEKRRRLMNDWATYCSRPAPSTAEAVPIRRAG